LLNLKAYGLTLLQGLETAILNGAEVNKHIVSVLGLDETEAFAFVKPFDFALHHRSPPPFLFFSRTDYDDAQKNHCTLENVVVWHDRICFHPALRHPIPSGDQECLKER